MVAAFDYCLHGKGGAAPSIDTAMHGLVDAATWTTCTRTPGSPSRPPWTARQLTPTIFGDGWSGCRGAARASSSGSTSPRSRTRTRRRSAASSAGTASPPGATPARRPSATRSGSSTPRRSTSPSTPSPSRSARRRPATSRCPRPSAAPGRRPWPRTIRGDRVARPRRWSATSPTPSRARLPVRAEHPRLAALGTTCPDHFLRTKVRPLVLDLPADATVEEPSPGCTSCTTAYRADYQAYYDRNATPDSPAMRGRRPG